MFYFINFFFLEKAIETNSSDNLWWNRWIYAQKLVHITQSI